MSKQQQRTMDRNIRACGIPYTRVLKKKRELRGEIGAFEKGVKDMTLAMSITLIELNESVQRIVRRMRL